MDVSVGSTGEGIAEESAVSGIRLWPNPTTGMVNIALGEAKGRISIDVNDITGRLVMALNGDAVVQQNGLLTVDLGKLATGEYTLNVRHDAGVSVNRLVVR